MWNWFNCYLSGRHEYGVWCDPGVIFLRCMHCGRRSPGWTLDRRTPPLPTEPTPTRTRPQPEGAGRVVPFGRAAAN
jgi:hypothetical protein